MVLKASAGAVAWASAGSESDADEAEVSAKDADDGAMAAATGSAGRTTLPRSKQNPQRRPN
jgi:hypothetical protein